LNYFGKQKNELRKDHPYHYKNVNSDNGDILKNPKNIFISHFIFIKPTTAHTVYTAVQFIKPTAAHIVYTAVQFIKPTTAHIVYTAVQFIKPTTAHTVYTAVQFIKPTTAHTVYTAVQFLISSCVLAATHHHQGLYTQVHLKHNKV
jgi:predicted house-cleaning NTP pyrophosphatase (Maf/HAM1 superfamily)